MGTTEWQRRRRSENDDDGDAIVRPVIVATDEARGWRDPRAVTARVTAPRDASIIPVSRTRRANGGIGGDVVPAGPRANDLWVRGKQKSQRKIFSSFLRWSDCGLSVLHHYLSL
jgi:hypothetical protein